MLLSESLLHSLMAGLLGLGILTIEYLQCNLSIITTRQQIALALILTAVIGI